MAGPSAIEILRRKRVAFFAVSLCTALQLAANDTAGSISDDWALKCGPNSLLVFLILSGRADATLDHLGDMSISRDGTSLLTLRDAAKRFGFRAEIRYYRPDKIDSVPLPAIVQLKCFENSVSAHHFNVIYKLDAQNVYMIDGTTGSRCMLKRTSFADLWTGYTMVEKPSLGTREMNWCWSLLFVACLFIVDVVFLSLLLRSFRNRQMNKAIIREITKGEVAV
jgi:ABC-type bacteriocin/lantibiotic exporter with double-glycine peptidase domain